MIYLGGRAEPARLHLGPGWLPGYAARRFRRPTLAYTRLRRRSQRRRKEEATIGGSVNNEIVLFDHGPTEFPVATARPRELRARGVAMLADLQRWLTARWTWFKPRTVPCAVAGLGMLAVLASANYLAHQHGKQTKPSVTVVHNVDIVPHALPR